ncbi:MAG: Asp-tRNA(Asn)/Glu-tRNA(Gln) amidotransferase subunit GatC [Planctomycetota bacterium]|nr:Asp-tRNA(Asn)/Glu-tRNA(Gln) amidotransferase subunit GatC [Planctomycetota bacterium]
MDVTHDLVRHVAHLARLELTEEEVAEMQPQLAAILHHVEQVQEIDCGDAEPATQEAIDFDALRTDETGETLDRRSITKNAPQHDGSFLVVPRILDAD